MKVKGAPEGEIQLKVRVTERSFKWELSVFYFLADSVCYSVFEEILLQKVLGSSGMEYALVGVSFFDVVSSSSSVIWGISDK